MVRLRKISNYQLVVMLLVTALLVSPAGIASADFVHSVHGDSAVSHDCQPEVSTSGSNIADHSDENTCHHEVELGCGSGDCCFPFPIARASYSEKQRLADPFDIVSSALLDKRLDPPPPRIS